MSSSDTFVIVGAGLAGAKAAETLRSEGFDGRVVLVGSESERPYERPPLSKGYLTGSDEKSAIYVHDADFYDSRNIEVLLGTAVESLDPDEHRVVLADGQRIGYTKALVATGAEPKTLPVPGADLPGVHYLRTAADSEALRSALSGGGRNVVVVGAGWIGLETAAAARGYDNTVTVVEPEQTVLYAALGAELGEHFAGLHRDHGVDLRLRTGVREIRGSGSVSAVVTDGGDQIPADLVIVGIGIRPRTGLAEAAGLQVDDGIVVDEMLRTSHPDVHAAGDVARSRYPSLGRHLRVEHWANALNGGPAAARSMLGGAEPYDPVPYFFTDQYDLGMEFSGVATPGAYDRVVYRGDPAGGEFIAFWLSGGRVVAGMNVNVWDVTPAVEALIRSDAPVDLARLTDTSVPLEDLAPN